MTKDYSAAAMVYSLCKTCFLLGKGDLPDDAFDGVYKRLVEEYEPR